MQCLFIKYILSSLNATIHEGRNVKRIREMLGIKQEALAFDPGLSQQTISLLEHFVVRKKSVDDLWKQRNAASNQKSLL